MLAYFTFQDEYKYFVTYNEEYILRNSILQNTKKRYYALKNVLLQLYFQILKHQV